MKVLLIDDHPLILAALQSVIQGLGDNVTVSAADSGRAARETLRNDPSYDLVLLDLHLGDADGFDLLGELRSKYPALPVVVISASDRTSDVIRAIDMGAMGFVPKRATNETLFDALQQVMSGGVYVPPMSMGADNMTQLSSSPHIQQVQREATESSFQTVPSLVQLGLTPRQSDVLNLLLKGQPNKLIARELGLSVETVKDHVAAVLRALGVSSRTQAVIAVSQILQKQSGTATAAPGSAGAWRTR
ncbi:MAG TPA: response regulator transcription factor [Aquabacterium sp.]|uniref:response regulator transcription factor n=1 Tax=Aquabacterium sp. TaxID=1872578 RepID=UPI002E35FFF9|nr:response regulator transcription factor [Aquabacterium sp.]HEX5372192.1 response regulator transcription factor [Aquabacterium sp.]